MRTSLLAVLVATLTIAVPAWALHPAAPPAPPAAPEPLFAPGPLYDAVTARAATCTDADCRAAALAAVSEEVRSALAALPLGADGLHAATTYILQASGHDASPLPVDASPGLDAAFERLYLTIGANVDPADVREQTAPLAPARAAALLPLIDAIRVAHRETTHILTPDAHALLANDLATTMKLATFVGSAPPGIAPPGWQTLWNERAAALASADLDAMGRASATLTLAVRDYLNTDVPASASCDPTLDLPFVRIGGTCDDTYAAGETYLLLIDDGGDDTYLSGVGAGPFAGAGVGIAIDHGAGADTYTASGNAQGFGLGGVGLLIDEGGSDHYSVVTFGHGMGVAGLGLLHDMGTGNDVYTSPDPEDSDPIGTKAAALGGVGILIDEGGNDAYDQAGLDGFVYGAAGGSGWMLERGGDDTYRSDEIPIYLLGDFLGVFAGPIQISGEVGGTTVLFEEGGTDTYFCGPHVRQGCQGAAGAGSLTLLLEEDGNDAYTMGDSISIEVVPGVVVFPMGQGAGYGPSAPAGYALLREATGDDTYTAAKWAQGFATAGIGMLLDDTGNDVYTAGTALVGTRGNGQTWADGTGLGIGKDS